MSTWSGRAFEQFPRLRSTIEGGDYTIDTLLTDLLSCARTAHDEHDRDLASRVYGFAEWCLAQDDKDLWTAAGSAFYQHLFDYREYWPAVVPWLSPKVIVDCWPLWEARLEMQELVQIRKLFQDRQEHAYRELEIANRRSQV